MERVKLQKCLYSRNIFELVSFRTSLWNKQKKLFGLIFQMHYLAHTVRLQINWMLTLFKDKQWIRIRISILRASRKIKILNIWLTKNPIMTVKITPPMYPSTVFVGKCLLRGVLPNIFPMILAKKVLIGMQNKGNTTQKTPLYKL